MEKYLVSARKYRPATFASVVGQKALAVTLKNSITTDRLAHAYLFCGSRGVGKTSCARIFAKTINCTNRTEQGEACNECDSCRAFNENRSLNIIELDAASNNGVDDIRQLIEQTQVAPVDGKYRVFIIDEVHMLSQAAFNAFLKTLEEPPKSVIFILATTEKHKVLPTILSRCQIYDFNRITVESMVEHLQYVAQNEGIEVETAALNVIARKADGAMRDALSIFDQVAASSMGKITYQSTIDNLNVLDNAYYNRLLEAFLTANVTEALLIYKDIRDKGFNNHFFLNGLADYFRDLAVALDPRTLTLIETGEEHRQAMAQLAARCTPRMLYDGMELLNEADLRYREVANKQFLVELTLIKLCQAFSPSPKKGHGEGRKLKPIVAAGTQSASATPQPPTQPQPSQAPMQAPAASAAQRSAPAASVGGGGTRLKGVGPTMSLRMQPAAAASAPTTPPQASAPNAAPHSAPASATEPLTVEAVKRVWRQLAEDYSSEFALATTLRTCLPAQQADGTWVVAVESPAQQSSIEQRLPTLCRTVGQRFGLPELPIKVMLVEGDGSPATWTESRVLQHILDNHDIIRTMVEELHLSLQ